MTTKLNVESMSALELMSTYVAIIKELKERKITRTLNAPLGDYAEQLVAEKLELKLVGNSTAGHDAVDTSGRKYQIKARMLSRITRSTRFSVIRNLESRHFDFLIIVIFGPEITVQKAVQIPFEVLKAPYVSFSEHTRGYTPILRDGLMQMDGVQDITKRLL